jgi:hypothetical protein
MRSVPPAPALGGLILFAAVVTACSEPVDFTISTPIPLTYQNGLLYAYGEALSSQDGHCTTDPSNPPPAPPASPRIVLDVAMPLSVIGNSSSGGGALEPQPFQNGEVMINATEPDGSMGPSRFMLCNVPLLLGNQAVPDFRLETQAPGGPLQSTGPLGAVLGGDLFGQNALTFDFLSSAAMPLTPTAAQVTIGPSDITPWCLIDDAVLPFQPVGGSLLVQVGDSVVTYNPTEITVAACVEPLADPLVIHSGQTQVQSCVDPTKFASLPPSDCSNLTQLNDDVDNNGLRTLAYEPSGADMRFLISSAVPELLLSETACSRLAGAPGRCQCPDNQKVSLRLPGLDGPQPDGSDIIETGCMVQLGGGGNAALALIATQLQLSPCAELARSRRQRFALPRYDLTEIPPLSDCLREACLENFNRDPSLTFNRCAYTGMLVEQACDDHQAPVAAYVELGGTPDDLTLPDDTLSALVVPDTAQILQSVNTDLRNTTSQVDGVIGVSLLSRLRTVVDYPQNRVVLGCRCGGYPTEVCRTYRGVSYYDANNCVTTDTLFIPEDFGRSACSTALPQ